MARINTVTAKDASTSTRIMFWFTARLIGRLAGRRPEGMLVPLQQYAHLPGCCAPTGVWNRQPVRCTV